MNWIIYLFGGGYVLFVAIALLICGLLASATTKRLLARAATLGIVVGLILLVASGTALHPVLLVAAGLITLASLGARNLSHRAGKRIELILRAATVIFWLIAAALELPYQFLPTMHKASANTLYVIGDSLSAGLGEANQATWPQRLASSHGIRVENYSRAGATVGSTVLRVTEIQLGPGVVLLEIGGNDLLGSTTAAEFEASLAELLSSTSAPDRQVLMFELPSLPLKNEFARIQRRQANAHGVQLIPKRILMSSLTAENATVDSVHLSDRGHEDMARAVWRVVGPAFEQ